MRRVMSLLMFFAWLTAQAAQPADEKKGVSCDQVRYRVTYATRSVSDTTSVPYRYREDDMRLDIGDSVTAFYSQSVLLRDSALTAMIGRGFVDMKTVGKRGFIQWKYYKNYPKNDFSELLDNVGMSNYKCIEKVEIPQWELNPDSTAVILGYTCHLATTHFKGRQWCAWYAEDIPLSDGPWKLCGLPGLILRAYEARRQFVFDGIGLQHCDGTEHITINDKGAEVISQRDLTKAKERYDPSSILSEVGGKEVKVVGPDGKAVKLPKRQRFNPIEL